MATAGRLDGATIDQATGRITVKITTGEVPLPLTWQGQSLVFNGSEELKAAIAALEARLTPDELAIVQLAAAVKADPTLGTVFLAKCSAKTCALDLTGTVSVISVGA